MTRPKMKTNITAAKKFERAAPRSCGGRRGHRARAWRETLSSSFAQAPSGMVQKKVFQAGLGDVYVAQFDAGGGGEIGDFGDQRAAAVGVEIGAVAISGADFADTSQSLEPLKHVRRMHAEPEAEQVPARDGRFQLLRSSQGDDAAVIDNREAFAERVGFFHVVRGQQNRFAALVVFADDLP